MRTTTKATVAIRTVSMPMGMPRTGSATFVAVGVGHPLANLSQAGRQLQIQCTPAAEVKRGERVDHKDAYWPANPNLAAMQAGRPVGVSGGSSSRSPALSRWACESEFRLPAYGRSARYAKPWTTDARGGLRAR